MTTQRSVLAVSNHDAQIPNADPRLVRGMVRAIPFTIEKAAGDDDGSVIQIAQVRSSDVVKSIKIWNDALAGATAVDIGLYDDQPPADATAVDDDVYASAVNISAGLSGAEQAFEARDLADMTKRVWEDAGLSKDPRVNYRIALTGDTFGTAAGTISGVVEVITG